MIMRGGKKNCKRTFNAEKKVEKLTTNSLHIVTVSFLFSFSLLKYILTLNQCLCTRCVWMRRGDRSWGFINFSYSCCFSLLLVFLLCLLLGQQRKNTTKSNLSHKIKPMPCPRCVVKKKISCVSPITVKSLCPERGLLSESWPSHDFLYKCSPCDLQRDKW